MKAADVLLVSVCAILTFLAFTEGIDYIHALQEQERLRFEEEDALAERTMFLMDKLSKEDKDSAGEYMERVRATRQLNLDVHESIQVLADKVFYLYVSRITMEACVSIEHYLSLERMHPDPQFNPEFRVGMQRKSFRAYKHAIAALTSKDIPRPITKEAARALINAACEKIRHVNQ